MLSAPELRKQVEEALEDALKSSRDKSMVKTVSTKIADWIRPAAGDADELRERMTFVFQLLGSMGYFDPDRRGRSRPRAELNRLVRDLIVYDPDYGAWIESGTAVAKIYESFIATLATKPTSEFSSAIAWDRVQPTILLWCAFAPGAYANVERDDWGGIKAPDGEGARYWVFESEKADDLGIKSNKNTPYDSYVDHVYDRLGRLSDPIDIVFADFVMLQDLEERRMITPLGKYDPRLEPYYPAGSRVSRARIGRTGELGKLATINYHVPALVKRLVPDNPAAVQNSSKLDAEILAALRSLVVERDAAPIIDYRAASSAEGLDAVLTDDIGKSLDFPGIWKDEMRAGLNSSDVSCLSGAAFAARWATAGEISSSISATPDPFLIKLGELHPIAPLQLARGAHSTYSCFAYLANTSSLVSGFVERADTDVSDQAERFYSPQTNKRLTKDQLAKDTCVRHRSGGYLRMPSNRCLERRASRLFNFIWHFAPALSVCFDHVAAARAREHIYADRWFDPCMPIEAVLFHQSRWLNDIRIEAAPAWLEMESRPLSCFGGYALAVSSDASSVSHAQHLCDHLLTNMKSHTIAGSQYSKVIPVENNPGSIAQSALRPPVSFWPLLDSTIAETLRMHVAALIALRSLKADCVLATLGRATGIKPEIFRDSFEPAVRGVSPSFTLPELPRSPRIDAPYLFEATREFITPTSVNRLLEEVYVRSLPFWQTDELANAARANLSALQIDAKYIAGLSASFSSLSDLASSFVRICVHKLSQISAAKNWTLVQVLELGED